MIYTQFARYISLSGEVRQLRSAQGATQSDVVVRAEHYETEEEAKQEVDGKPGLLAQGSSRFSFPPSASEATYQLARAIGGWPTVSEHALSPRGVVTRAMRRSGACLRL
jgi:hypothetical protein